PIARMGPRVEVYGEVEEFPGFRLEIPGDISSATYFMAAAALIPGSRIEIEKVGLNPTRTGFLDVLVRMGADLMVTPTDESGAESIGTIMVRSGNLQGITIEPEQVPLLIDEIPLLAVVATQAEGITRITAAEELRYKETDRLMAIENCMAELGVPINMLEDGFEIEGPVKIKGGRVKSYGDHRIAMSMAIAGLISSEGVMIENAECVDISFPGFWDVLGGG
ncbi:MAG: 3-phosphoshikimate 1-carboxyvinyltransferase, partial [Candidatus Eremiobacteraeota bacterium]|nr:3-phosphoshikimate 1-carboxyvinyltransferase [Candidatus Eremiobacteraeota bacterium]